MKRSQTRKSKQFKLSAERVTFAIAALAVLIGLILLIWVTQTDQPPVLLVQQTAEVREANGQFYVPFRLENQGGETVEAVQVVGELRISATEVETGDLHIDFLAGGEQAEGAFVFNRDPAQGRLTLRVAGYQLP
jgi:uncharacterized protein (TIGR02588 family)